MKYFISAVLIFTSSFFLLAQDNDVDKIAFYSDVVRNASEPENRDHADQMLYGLIKEGLEAKALSSDYLGTLSWISYLTPADSSFGIISWMVELEDRAARYRNFLVLEDGTYSEIEDGGNELLIDGEYAVFPATEALAALYYKILPQYENGTITAYLLFGYRYYDKFENVKLIDVLNLNDNQISFGKELFHKTDANGDVDKKTRLILRYASDSQVSFQYNPNSDMLIFDHLIPRMGRLPGQGPTLLPDGSYEAYLFNKNKWVYKEKLFDQISKTPPMPEPILDTRPKSIIGKEKK